MDLDILYLALFPGRSDNLLNNDFFARAPNKLAALVPDAQRRAEAVRVTDLADMGEGSLTLNAGTLKLRMVCYLDGKADSLP